MKKPSWWRDEGADAFRNLETRPSDVVLASGVKMGTTWAARILHLLLHGTDAAGAETIAQGVNARGQCYPEGLTLAPVERTGVESLLFGDYTWPSLESQPEPRLFSTHLWGEHLPRRLVAPDGKGRLVIVARNLKDTLCSLHFFRGEPVDGWYGNSHGPGSLERFLSADCPNAFGSVFESLAAHDGVAQSIPERVHILYYEALIEDHTGEVARLARFLGLEATQAQIDAVVDATRFESMKEAGRVGKLKGADILLRQGGVGGWRQHLDAASWARFDRVCEDRLARCALARRLLEYH